MYVGQWWKIDENCLQSKVAANLMQHAFLTSDGQKSWANGVRQTRQSYAVGNIEGLISLDLDTEIWLWYNVLFASQSGTASECLGLILIQLCFGFLCCNLLQSVAKVTKVQGLQSVTVPCFAAARRVLPQASRHMAQEPRLGSHTTNRSKILKNKIYRKKPTKISYVYVIHVPIQACQNLIERKQSRGDPQSPGGIESCPSTRTRSIPAPPYIIYIYNIYTYMCFILFIYLFIYLSIMHISLW